MAGSGDTSKCKGAGIVVPVIDRTRCEGKNACVRECPTDVFELRKLTADEKRELSAFVRFKLFVHGGKQAFVVRPDACEACSICVKVCPEQAITLVKPSAAR
jgi:NAD-dependent dihydropyrimidine dehydrogenase PreA subunit